MKRIASLILAAAFMLGGMSAAQAIDTKVKGTWNFSFGWGVHERFQDHQQAKGDNNFDTFRARQRVRTQIDFIASENLQGVLMFEIGILDWGNDKTENVDGKSGASLDADGANIKTKRAYLDWMIPDTGVSVRMGIQGISLPMATRFNNPVFSADVAGIATSYTFDNTFGVTAFWARPFNSKSNGIGSSDKTDLFGLSLPVTLDGVAFTPWGAVARVGNNSNFYNYTFAGKNNISDLNNRNHTATAFWTGLGVSVDVCDPLTFAVDAMYGRIQKQEATSVGSNLRGFNGFGDEAGASGWFVTSTLDYKLDWGTPGLLGWWSTGDKAKGLNGNKLGRMPVLGLDDSFNPTSFGFANNAILTSRSILSGSGMGTWGIGAQIADISFIEDLTHVIRVVYMRGTNDKKLAPAADALMLNKDNVYLTTKDYALEVDLSNTFQIYENLTTTLELGYINLDLDKDTWGKSYVNDKNSDAWKAQVNLHYSF